MSVSLLVQARSDSSRLESKMTKFLDSATILEWVLKRARKSKKADQFILATTHNPRDKELIKIGKKNRFKIFKGSDQNVLKRFYECAKNFKSRIIVRVCADNPLIDAREIDFLIDKFKKGKFDYLYNTMQTNNNFNADGFGAEIFSYDALLKAYKFAKKKRDKEHVTTFIRNNRKLFRIKCLEPKLGLNFPYLKFDINTSKDLLKIKKLIHNQKINKDTDAKKIINTMVSSEIDKYLKILFPLNRSLTGEGNIKTLKIINNITKIKIKKIPSEKKVYDWVVPKVWSVQEAWIKNLKSNDKIVDYKKNNLHLVNYSSSFNGVISSKKLLKNLHFHPKLKDAIPYKTSYFQKNWGFCVSKNLYQKISNSSNKYQVKIKSNFKKKNLVYGEKIIKGKSNHEILISTYICHPSMANDNLSGVIMTAFLAKFISSIKNRYWTYRIIFVPETIGAIAYLNKNEKKIKKIRFGLVVSNVGGKGKFSFKKSFQQDHFLNFLIKDIFKKEKMKLKEYDFDINGSDERQYSSQYFKMNICSIFKDKYYEFKEYHTSKDNLNFVKSENIFQSLIIYQKLIEKLEKQIIFQSKITKGEVMLSKYNLYPKIGGDILPGKKKWSKIDLTLWLLFLADSSKPVEQISNFLKIPKKNIIEIYKKFEKKKLVYRV